MPAAEARIGVVDQLFSRVGAADDLARGRSTFMVEMVETAAILNQAGPRALVILDEIGRGTATYDGLSIAWAVLEHLHDVNRCRALFATHYHELTALAAKLPGLRNATVAVREWQGEVIFLHEVQDGAADRSYGVQVARLAGLPAAVVERARVVLDALERGERERGGKAKALVDDLPLFAVAARRRRPPPPRASPVEARLRAVLPDELSPREALALVYELQGLRDGRLDRRSCVGARLMHHGARSMPEAAASDGRSGVRVRMERLRLTGDPHSSSACVAQYGVAGALRSVLAGARRAAARRDRDDPGLRRGGGRQAEHRCSRRRRHS